MLPSAMEQIMEFRPRLFVVLYLGTTGMYSLSVFCWCALAICGSGDVSPLHSPIAAVPTALAHQVVFGLAGLVALAIAAACFVYARAYATHARLYADRSWAISYLGCSRISRSSLLVHHVQGVGVAFGGIKGWLPLICPGTVLLSHDRDCYNINIRSPRELKKLREMVECI